MNKTNQNKKVRVSDHAVIRYMERIMNVDVEYIRSVILSENSKQIAMGLGGNCKIKEDDFTITIKDYTVVTVLPKKKNKFYENNYKNKDVPLHRYNCTLCVWNHLRSDEYF